MNLPCKTLTLFFFDNKAKDETNPSFQMKTMKVNEGENVSLTCRIKNDSIGKNYTTSYTEKFLTYMVTNISRLINYVHVCPYSEIFVATYLDVECKIF